MSMVSVQFRCDLCGHLEPLTQAIWRCPVCGGPLAFDHLPTIDPAEIIRAEPSLWRYAAALPVVRGETRALGSSMTPLVAGTLAGHPVRFKLDSLLPTGSFKDRGASVMIAWLKSIGVQRVIVDSSGNAAAAMAGFAAANGLECIVYAPATTSPGKLVQSRAFGARVVLVDGPRDAVATAAQEAARQDPTAFYASHNWHPVFVEGVKTWALEVWEQLGFATPTTAWIPTGGGSAFVGGWRGFRAVSDTPPALVAVQPAACAPVVAAWQQHLEEVQPVPAGETIAEGTKIGAPARGRQILSAIRDTAGSATAVSEPEIAAALNELWRQGLYVEPTAAIGAAAFRAAVERGLPVADGEHVILLTGNGLKATETIARLVG